MVCMVPRALAARPIKRALPKSPTKSPTTGHLDMAPRALAARPIRDHEVRFADVHLGELEVLGQFVEVGLHCTGSLALVGICRTDTRERSIDMAYLVFSTHRYCYGIFRTDTPLTPNTLASALVLSALSV
jgi:hypothetical protein